MTTPQTPATQVLLIRHGQSLHHRNGSRAGSDGGLTELGWHQAQSLSDWLARTHHVDAVVSSFAVCARQTGEVIGERLGLPIELHEGLEEADFPYWEELPARQASPLAAWEGNWQPDPENAPLYASFRARLYLSLERLFAAHAGQTVVVVTHGGPISTILRSLFGGHYMTVFTDFSSLTQLTWETDHWRLVVHNCMAHLHTQVVPSPAVAAPQGWAAPWADSQQLEAVIRQHDRVARALVESAFPTERELNEMLRLAQPTADDRVLDVGTGRGSVAMAFAPQVDSVLAVDVSPAMLERADSARLARDLRNVHFRFGEIGSLALEDRSFEIIISHDLLHYLRDPQALLVRLRTLLAPGGRLLVDQLVGSDDAVKRATQNAIELRRDSAITGVPSVAELERMLAAAEFNIATLERYTVGREFDEWLAEAAADDATRSAVRSMLEAGLEADSAGLAPRRGRDGQISLTQTRVRLLAIPATTPA
jgi:broad specificity phosphatase PhoE/SAM-dependent methyltransferase